MHTRCCCYFSPSFPARKSPRPGLQRLQNQRHGPVKGHDGLKRTNCRCPRPSLERIVFASPVSRMLVGELLCSALQISCGMRSLCTRAILVPAVMWFRISWERLRVILRTRRELAYGIPMPLRTSGPPYNNNNTAQYHY